MKAQEDKTLTQQHMFWTSTIIFFHWSPSIWTSSIFPSLLPSSPRDHPVCLGTRAPLHRVEMEGTYECVSVCLCMQGNEREEKKEEKKGRRTGALRWEHVDVERERVKERQQEGDRERKWGGEKTDETDEIKQRLKGQRSKGDKDGKGVRERQRGVLSS